MGRKKIPQRELAGFLAKLEEMGATEVQRSPAGFDGTVEVRWEDSELEREQRQTDLQAWKLPFLAAFVCLLVMAVTGLILLFLL
jgi:hypothetical protein